MPGTAVNGARTPRVPNTTNISFDRVEAERPAARPGVPLPAHPSAPRAQREAVAAHLAYADRVVFAPRRVVLVTYDPQRRALVGRAASRDLRPGSPGGR